MKTRQCEPFRMLALAVTLGSMLGCATEHVVTTGMQYPATRPEKVVVYHVQKPEKPYFEIGRVAIDKYNNLAISRSRDAMDRLLRERAASIGGDAVIAVTEDFGSISGVVIRNK